MALASLGKDLAIDVVINLLGWGASSVLQTDKFFDLLGGVTHVALVLRRILPWLIARKFSSAAQPAPSPRTSQQIASADDTGDYRRSEDYRRKVAGVSTFTAGASPSSKMHPRQLLSSVACCIWAVRLSGFLFLRHGEVLLAPGRIPWLGVGDSRFIRVVKMPMQFAKFWSFQASWCFLNLLPVLISNSKTEEELKDKPMNKWDYLGLGMWTGKHSPLLNRSVAVALPPTQVSLSGRRLPPGAAR